MPRRPLALAAPAAALLLAGCGSGSGDDPDAEVTVGTAVYAFEWLTEELGGDRVAVTNVTPPGADAHSLELAPAQVVDLEQSDLVVHLPEYQSAMDDAVAQLGGTSVLDASTPTRPLAPEELLAEGAGADEDHEHDDEDSASDDHEHDDDTHEDAAPETGGEDAHAGHDHGALDPHVWLDPERMIALAEEITASLSEIDPDGAETYAANLETVVTDLEDLGGRIGSELAGCEVSTVVVGHEAYGYLLAPHGFEETGLAGLDGGTEVSPARIAELTALVEDTGVSTLYRDANAPDDAVRAVAEQTSTEVAVLDPLEIAPAEGDYRDAMQANIDALATGQRCG
ncbi:metal ABC transporter substrate-binding protein [Georgenia sp. Z1344]|uniref:metal ABC transporter substrate-binding protein n=1 Tax=Georgenia sp. Z1344 TaxID=3416706 RepID=UPI003CEF7BFD